jgi:hypothetical protein
VAGTDPASYQIAAFGIKGVEHLCFANTVGQKHLRTVFKSLRRGPQKCNWNLVTTKQNSLPHSSLVGEFHADLHS